MGKRMLQWAHAAGVRQLSAARTRVADAAARVKAVEHQLLQARLDERHEMAQRVSWLRAAVADRSHRQLFEIDRLHRVLGEVAAASFETEHRLGADIRQSVFAELGSLDAVLVKVRARPKQYLGGMLGAALLEYMILRNKAVGKLKQLNDTGLFRRKLDLQQGSPGEVAHPDGRGEVS